MALDTAYRPILTLDHVNPKNTLMMPTLNKFQSEKSKLMPFGLGKTKPKPCRIVIFFDNLFVLRLTIKFLKRIKIPAWPPVPQ
jgi:hypothetical protein